MGSGRGGYDIYVDQTDDPDIGEILVVRKKKSRAGLDGVSWGAEEVDLNLNLNLNLKEGKGDGKEGKEESGGPLGGGGRIQRRRLRGRRI